jgi:hypothetical protein
MSSSIFVLIFISFAYAGNAKDLGVYNSRIVCETQANLLKQKYKDLIRSTQDFFCLEVEGKP